MLLERDGKLTVWKSKSSRLSYSNGGNYQLHVILKLISQMVEQIRILILKIYSSTMDKRAD